MMRRKGRGRARRSRVASTMLDTSLSGRCGRGTGARRATSGSAEAGVAGLRAIGSATVPSCIGGPCAAAAAPLHLRSGCCCAAQAATMAPTAAVQRATFTLDDGCRRPPPSSKKPAASLHGWSTADTGSMSDRVIREGTHASGAGALTESAEGAGTGTGKVATRPNMQRVLTMKTAVLALVPYGLAVDTEAAASGAAAAAGAPPSWAAAWQRSADCCLPASTTCTMPLRLQHAVCATKGLAQGAMVANALIVS